MASTQQMDQTRDGDQEGKGGWVGRPVRRVEDAELVAGRGQYVGDLTRPGMLHAAFVRSSVAAGRIRRIDTSQAREIDGVVEIMCGEDIPETADLTATLEREGFWETPMPLLARDVVRHVGEPIAIVIAVSRAVAEDAVDAVQVDIDLRKSVTSIDSALPPGAPAVFSPVPGNVVIDATVEGWVERADEAAASAAARSIKIERSTGRLFAMPIEGRACLASWESPSQLVVHASTQVPFILRMALAQALELPESGVRVIVPEVGGGFGLKCAIGREELVVALAAHSLRGAVRWVEDRSESFVAGFHSKEQRYVIEGAFDDEGRLLSLEADVLCDVGAYNCYPYTAGVEVLMAASQLHGPYKVPRYRVRSRGVLTNKVPIAPYRGVSRPQVVLAMEGLMDEAAEVLGLDPVAIRLRNLIGAKDFPYTGANGVTYDRGSYRESLELCRDSIDYADWREFQAAARQADRLIGVGFACFSESTAYGMSEFAARGMDVTPGVENVRVRMDPSGRVQADVGTMSHGQGHRTSFAQVVADELEIPLSHVRIRQGDTDVVPFGWGSFASRSAVVSSEALMQACAELRKQLIDLGSSLLGRQSDEVDFEGGAIRSRDGSGGAVSLADIARIVHYSPQELPDQVRWTLEASASYDPTGTFANATHACVVEIDTATWGVEILRYLVVEDCGVVLNPMIVEGQTLGGIAQGIGAVLYEELVYSDAGQLVTTTLMDYLTPTAAEMPHVEIHHLETPSEYGQSGAKGAGESGTIGAPAAVANAVNDALRPLGVSCKQIPITPDRLMSVVRGDVVSGGGAAQ